MNRHVNVGPLVCPFACSLALLTHLLHPPCPLCWSALLRSFVSWIIHSLPSSCKSESLDAETSGFLNHSAIHGYWPNRDQRRMIMSRQGNCQSASKRRSPCHIATMPHRPQAQKNDIVLRGILKNFAAINNDFFKVLQQNCSKISLFLFFF